MHLLLDKDFYPFMKITLAHSSKFSSYKIPWLYFGSSYLKMKYCEKKLSGPKINLQHKIHSQADLQKEEFVKWIEAHRVKNKDSIYWWMTHLASRNNFYSNFFLNLCQLFAITDYIKKNTTQKDILIICEDIFLLKLLSQNLKSQSQLQFPFFLIFYWFKDISSLLVKGLFNKLKLIYIFSIHYLYARLTRPKKITKPQGNIKLFHHCLENTDSFKNDTLTCKYFTILPDWLEKQGEKVVGLPWLFKNVPSKNFYRNLRKANCLIPEDWLGIKDYIDIFKSSLKSSKTLTYDIQYSGAQINHLILREKLSQLGESNAIFFRYIPAIKKWSTDLKSLTIYDQYENMIFEHPIRYIIKKLPIKSISVGFFHSLVSKEFMGYHYSDSEWKSPIKPDYVACSTKIGENLLLKQGVPKEKLLSVAALRQSVNTSKSLSKKETSNRLLILLSLLPEHSAEILMKVYSNNSLILDKLKLKIRVKIHPMMEIKDILKKVKWNKLPYGWEWANKDINSELSGSYCTISMASASIYDSVIMGNISISLMSDLNLMDNYLDIFSNKYPLTHSVSEKELVSKLNDIFLFKAQEYQNEFSQIRNELIEGINSINSKNLNAFLL